MAYSDFNLVTLIKQFQLTIHEDQDLFSAVEAYAVDPYFLTRLAENVQMALAISTEKARSEFIIAPILAELRHLTNQRIGLFSGVDFTVAPEQGLAGVCDFIISHSPEQLLVRAPVIMLVEAKNEDMKRGYAQCIAEMIAAQTFNQREGIEIAPIYGVVTTGNNWRFLQLIEDIVQIDRREYYIERPEKIIGILWHLVRESEG
ncbi:MAG: hypothetical protein U0350_32435 [Caldilineaceae bacterium]